MIGGRREGERERESNRRKEGGREGERKREYTFFRIFYFHCCDIG
jgi:hypothetical protein